MTTTRLRNYQQQICERTSKVFESHRSVMVQMPTGTGKTIVLASLMHVESSSNNRTSSVLIVAHRRELIEQIKTTIRRLGLDTSSVIVESIQTVTRRISAGTMKIRPELIIIDEAHHALARTYQMLWQQWPEARFLGLTATPYRLNGEGFTELFDTLLTSDSVSRFIADGWLSPYDYYSIPSDCEESRAIAALRKRNVDGDFQTKEMREVLDVRPSLKRLYMSKSELAPGRKGIVYAIDITHAEHIADFYCSKGISAKAISAATPKKERESDIQRFRAGEIEVLVNVDLFSEGFDCPEVEFIQLARPTLSLARYLQMVGRGLRGYEGKACCIILDNVGLYIRFGLPSDDRDWMASFQGETSLSPYVNEVLTSLRNLDRISYRLHNQDKEQDSPLVSIVSHDRLRRMAGNFKDFVYNGKIWIDQRNGIAFKSRPASFLFCGVELSTDDGLMFYPRISSSYIRQDKGLTRRCLEMQMGNGLFWQGLLIPGNMPDSVFELEKRLKSGLRIFHDENGVCFIQETPDHPIRMMNHREELDQWIASWDLAAEKWDWEIEQMIRERTERYERIMARLQKKEGSNVTYLESDIAYIASDQGQELWIDRRTGFVHYAQPILFKRGFLELLQEGEMFFVRNVRDAACYPYMNYMIAADDEICVIGDRLYVRKEYCMGSYKVKYRSDDFTYFRTGTNRYQLDYDVDMEITHKPGTDPIIKVLQR